MNDLEKRLLELELKMEVVKTALIQFDNISCKQLAETVQEDFNDIHKFVEEQP